MPENAAERIYYPVNDNDTMIVFRKQDSEQPSILFSLYMKRDITPMAERASLAFYADGYKSALVNFMLRERLKELTDQANPPLLSASARDGSFFISATKDAFSLSAGLKQEDPLGGIRAAVGITEQARQHGFTESELQRAKAERLRVFQNRYNQRETMPNRHYVSECLRNFTENEPIVSAGEQLRLARQLNDEITLADVNAMAREMISDQNQVVTLYGPDKGGFLLPSETEIEQTILAAQKATYQPRQEEAIDTRLMTRLPRKGKIRKRAPGTNGYHEYTLSNGMRVFARKTDLEGDRISMHIFSPGGKSLYPDSDIPTLAYLSSVVQESGVSTFDDRTLKKMLAGKTAVVTPFVGAETEGMQGTSTQRDFETMLTLTHLYFTQPRFDREAFESLMNRQASFLTNRDANPNVQYNDSVMIILYGNHPRVQPMTKERLAEVSFDRIAQIYRERFADASDFNVILTGNLDEQTLEPLLCRYLASLPSKHVSEQVVDRKMDIRPVSETHTFRKQQATPSALTNIYITAPIAYTAWNDLRLSVLCQLMRMVYTEKVREEQGGTYGVSVQGSMQKIPSDEALMKINFRTDPGKYEQLLPIIYEQLDSMALYGPSEKDLQKVKEYEHKAYGQNTKTNGYWDYVKYNELFNGIDFDLNYRQLVDSLSTEDIRQFCQQLLAPRHRIQVTMLPEDATQ